MEKILKEIISRMVNSLRIIITLSSTYKLCKDSELKLKKIDCLLTEAELIIEELEQFEKEVMDRYEKDIDGII